MPTDVYSAKLLKNNERLLGTKMKKIVLMLLVLSLLCLASCQFSDNEEEKDTNSSNTNSDVSDNNSDVSDVVEETPVSKLCEAAKNSNPTRIVTGVTYLTNVGDTLSGHYITTTDGTNVIFDFYYEKIATPAESLATGDYRRIVPVEGVIYYKDGSYYSGDGDKWRPGTGAALDLKLNFDKDLFKNATVSDSNDGQKLKVEFNTAELTAFIGTDLNAVGDATVEITVIGQNLTWVKVSCTTSNGKLTIENSYTYVKQDLSSES